MALIGEMQYLTIGENTYSLPAGGGGTVTSIAVSNATNGGLSVSGSPISSSGTITIGHSNVLAAAQTTQAVYPITIDKNGHISAYGTAIDLEEMKLFLVTITQDSDNYVSDKTAEEIYDAFNAGRVVLLYADYSYVLLSSIYGDGTYYQADFYKSKATSVGFELYEYIVVTNNNVTSVEFTYYDKPVNNATLTIKKNGITVNSFTANASSNVTANITVPTKVSDLTNDSGFITGYTETDPTVPSWAKASSKPSYNFSEIGSIPTSISGYGITDAYTKSEVDGLVSGVLHYKGTKATVSALPSSGNTIGDVWHVTADGSEWAWDGTIWQELGTAVDLSGYVPTSRTINSKALTGNISLTASDVGALPSSTTIPSKTSDLTNDSGFIISETDPVFSASAAAGITSADITNWNNKISDDKTWNGVTLDKSTVYGTDFYVPNFSSTSATSAQLTYVTTTPSAGKIPRYDSSNYLISTTPSANDNSTKVATTAYVDDAIPTKTSDLTNDSLQPKTFWFGGSTTGPTVATKVVTTVTGDFTLAVGNCVRIMFESGNQAGAYLNIDGTGAKTLESSTYKWQAGETIDVVYNGTSFNLVNKGVASSTYYGITKLSDSVTSTSQSLAATPKAVKTAYDLAAGKQDILVSGTNIKTINNQSLLGSGDIDLDISSTSVPTANKIAEFDSTAHMNSTDMTSTEVSSFVGSLGYTFNLIDMFYPVGSYYETSDSTFNPNITWGGTWVVKSSFDNGIVLFDNDTQSVSGGITLSDSAANYDRIDICYRTNDNFYDSTSVYAPNNKNAILWTAGVTATTNNHGRVYLKIKVVNITGTIINTQYNNVSGTYYYYTAEKDTGVTGVGTVGDYIAITQVIGYKTTYCWHRTA